MGFGKRGGMGERGEEILKEKRNIRGTKIVRISRIASYDALCMTVNVIFPKEGITVTLTSRTQRDFETKESGASCLLISSVLVFNPGISAKGSRSSKEWGSPSSPCSERNT